MSEQDEHDGQSLPGDAVEPDPNEPIVVGIGASAGGLDALKRLFNAIPRDTGMAFVIVVHLSEDHESFLAELVQPGASLPVTQVTETTRLEADHVYVIPPGRNLDTIDTHLRLTELERDRRRRAPIDHFFRTLAGTHDGRAIGVVLTGTGSDGALGVRRIKERGGVTIVQDPLDAEFDGMPQSALATGAVDLVLPLDRIPETLARLSGTTPRIDLPADDEEADEDDARLLVKLFAHLQGRTGRDYSRYKHSTLLRRIRRRMQLRGISELSDYLDLVRESGDEVHDLGEDLLITVSSFFRDPEVFDALADGVVPRLFDGKSATDEIRVWSVGCATGEEAYSLAMLLLEEADRHEAPPRLQVFASDLHEHSLSLAREGFYPGDIEADVRPDRLARFFEAVEGGYRVSDQLRETVLFAPHNLLADPPFSRIDLISCRNVLIYLQRDVQRDVAQVFHYALQPGGALVLGTSETIDASGSFGVVDKPHCIYRKRNVPIGEPRLPVFPLTRARTRTRADRPAPAGGESPPSFDELHGRLLAAHGPASLLVAPDDRIVHVSNRAGQYLVHREGQISDHLTRLIRDELLGELRAVLHGAREDGPQRSQPVTVELPGRTAHVVVDARPAIDTDTSGFVLVLFEEVEPPPRQPTHDAGPIDDQDLSDPERMRLAHEERDIAHRRLQAIVEEYETSQEELKASNEELQSANEELRSTLEELETSREELQSMNEELQTVAQENRHKVEELGQLSSDLSNFLSATDIATLFLDRELRIMRFTPAVSNLFNVRLTDRGRPISDLTHRLGYDDLASDAAEVLRRLIPVEREIRADGGEWYLTRILPYRTTDDRIDGVVITLVDITFQKQAEEALRASERLFRATAEHLPLLVWVSDPSGGLTWVNETYCSFVGLSREASLGDRWRSLVHPDDVDRFARRFIEARAAQTDMHDEIRVRHADGSWRWLELWAQPRFDADGEFLGHLGTSADVTDRKEAHEALRATAEQAAIRAELLDALRPLDDPVAIQAKAARIVAEHLGASRVHYATVDPTGDWGTVEADYSPELPSVVGRHRFDEHGPIIMSGMRQGRVVLVEDVEHDERLDEQHRASTLGLGIRSYVMVPLVREGRVVALIVAHHATPRVWRPNELAILEEALARTWSAVERAQAVRAVRLSEERLRYVLDAVPSVVFTTDQDGHVDLAIGQTQAILGTRPDEVTGTLMWPDLIHDLDRERVTDEWHRARAAAETFESRYRIAATDRWVMVRSVPIHDDGGRIVQWFGTITDVDALTTAERELAEINDTLEQRVLEGLDRARELASSLSRAEHDERRRLGQVLHDDLQQILYSVQLKLGTAWDELVDGTEGGAEEQLSEVQERLAQAIEITRNLTIDLSPPLLNNDDLQAALAWLVSYMHDLHGLDVTVEFAESFDVDDDLRTMLFHISRELLFNVAKHAETDHATVHVERRDGDLLLVVHDSGRGFDPEVLGTSDGVGLTNVRDRLQLLAGDLDIDARPGGGCTITVRVPLSERQRGAASGD